MKILSISTDRKIFEKNSESRERMIEYGKLFDEFHIVVFNKQITNKASQITNQKIAENVWIYPTNSRNKFFYIFDAYKIASEIATNSWCVTGQDPYETGFVAWLIA